MCPRINLLLSVANATNALAPSSVNVPSTFSVASHFMLFSGVTDPKLSLIICALSPAARRPWSVATPMYFLPWALKAASSEQLAPFLPLPPVLGVALEEELGAATVLDEAITTALEVASVSGSGSTDVGVGVEVTVSKVVALLDGAGAADGTTTILVTLPVGSGAVVGSAVVVDVSTVDAGALPPPF